MEVYTFMAGWLAIVVGLVHTLLGERLIFSRMRKQGVIPAFGQPVLRERHVRVLWASWHIVSIFGWALGLQLIHAARPFTELGVLQFSLRSIVIAMLCSSVLVLVATKGRHPGWIGLLVVAAFTSLHPGI